MSSQGPCFLYAIATIQNGKISKPVKIGISASPYARLADLQVGSPVKLTLVSMLLAPTRDVARDTERFVHERYARWRLHGEWFDISPWAAVGAIGNFIAARIDVHFGHYGSEDVEDAQ